MMKTDIPIPSFGSICMKVIEKLQPEVIFCSILTESGKASMNNELKLISLQTEAYSHGYHDIRKRVLFSMEGRINPDYDPNHPDETKEGNYPLVLVEGETVIGTIRIDKYAESSVIFRLMAIKPDCQRKGYGRSLIQLAEKFSLALGSKTVLLNADPDAVTFYEKCGFKRSGWQEENKGAWIDDTISMEKTLA
jgi:GNAT superfamily N-acetyltransferase